MGNETDRTVQDDAMVTVFSSSNHDAEMESLAVKGALESAGIDAVVVGPHVLPNLEFQVQVPERLAADAKQLIEGSSKGGWRAAQEAEAETERT
jgi:hypothetical protein